MTRIIKKQFIEGLTVSQVVRFFENKDGFVASDGNRLSWYIVKEEPDLCLINVDEQGPGKASIEIRSSEGGVTLTFTDGHSWPRV